MIEKLQSEARYHCGEKECYKDGCTKNVELDIAIDIINQIDEPEKVVIPPYIDTWVQGAKYNGFDLLEAMALIDVPEETGRWISDNPEMFAKAWLYGYEVEKEKLYTVRLQATGEFIRFNEVTQFYYSGTSIKPVACQEKKYHHAKDTLKELLFWDNPAFEVEEVEE